MRKSKIDFDKVKTFEELKTVISILFEALKIRFTEECPEYKQLEPYLKDE